MERSLHDMSHVSYLVANMTIIVLAESVELIDGFYFPLETIREGLRKQYYDIRAIKTRISGLHDECKNTHCSIR